MAPTAAAAAAPVGAPYSRGRLGRFFRRGALARHQLATLQSLVTKHLTDLALIELAGGEDFALTSLERGLPRYEHPHLVAALDILLTYQRDRVAQGGCGVGVRKSYRDDPRTRFTEMLKRWLRSSACNASLGEEEVRRMCSLCRDVLNYPKLFPSKNSRSFLRTLAEVYHHLQLQLGEVLKRDRSCAELAAQALSISRNLISDSIAFLLLAATDLRQTDSVPSLEVVALWHSLPAEGNPLPGRADPDMQKVMLSAWETSCGSLIAALLEMPWAFRLFGGASAQAEVAAAAASALLDGPKRRAVADGPALRPPRAKSLCPRKAGEADGVPAAREGRAAAGAEPTMMGRILGRNTSPPPPAAPAPRPGAPRPLRRRGNSAPPPTGSAAVEEEEETEGAARWLGGKDRVPLLLEKVQAQFERGLLAGSGLAGPFREPTQEPARLQYLAAVEAVHDLVYLLGEVLVQFHRLSEGLGDYGMMSVAQWLHPFLEALVQKVQKLRTGLEAVNQAVDQELVMARARGRAVRKPVPTERQSARAHAAIERAVVGRDSHVQSLLQVLEELRARSAPERLPQLAHSLGDTCTRLQGVLSSEQFLACAGERFRALPPLVSQAQVKDTMAGSGDPGVICI